jgi:hypothetical protein
MTQDQSWLWMSQYEHLVVVAVGLVMVYWAYVIVSAIVEAWSNWTSSRSERRESRRRLQNTTST